MKKLMMTVAALMALGANAEGTKAVRHWAVEPMSDVMRLPDTEPKDGVPEGTVRITLARNEYEPGSFVVQSPDRDLGKVRFELGEFKRVSGSEFRVSGSGSQGEVVFPKENLDLKFLKVWYQNQNAWFCYFGDTGTMKLVPELLVNDEDLIRVDTAATNNFARLVEADGTVHEQWINPPREFDTRAPGFYIWGDTATFQPMKPNFRDAKTLQPVALPKGQYKQFFLTVHATKETPEGTYRGEVEVKSKGEKVKGEGEEVLARIPVEITVLPFELPRPKTWVRPDEDYLNCSYSYLSFEHILRLNGGDRDLMLRQFEAILRDQAVHGQDMHWCRHGFAATDQESLWEAYWTVDAMKRAGMRTDVLVMQANPTVKWPKKGEMPLTRHDFYTNALDVVKKFDAAIGHHNVYTGHGDEPSDKWLIDNRPLFEGCQDAGIKFLLAGWTRIFNRNPHAMDWQNMGTAPEDGAVAQKWNVLGKKSAWYGHLHVGPENPVINRRQYGLTPYFAGYTANCNYAHHLGGYNDDTVIYRQMNFVYGTGDGVLDTIQWEGFREGIDDIRYATLLRQLATKGRESADGETRRTALKALAYMANLKPDRDDLPAVRARFVDYILALRAAGVAVPAEKPLVACKDFKVPERPAHVEKEGMWMGQNTSPRYMAGDYEGLLGYFTNRCAREKRLRQDIGSMRLALYAATYAKCPQLVKDLVTTVTTNAPRHYKTNEVYEINFAAQALALRGDAKALVKRLGEIDAKFNAGVDPKFRLQAIERTASAALFGGDEKLARAFWTWRTSLLKPEPQKHYAVKWSDRPILGPESWDVLAVEDAVYDRKYQGSLEFLVTDVSTGDRGVSAANAQGETQAALSFACVADAWGLHFRFTDRNPDAPKIGVGAKNDGSYEMYLAPGPDAPHTCLMWTVGAGERCTTWHCAYECAGYRRLDENDTRSMRSQIVCRDDRIEGFLDLSWANWFAHVPRGKASWEFESMRWGRHSGAWNGTKSIHGRSTWGRLDFDLTDAQRAQIYQRLVFWAKNSGWRATADYWKDPELGDADFYAAVVKPREDALNERLQIVTDALDPMTALGIGPRLVRDLVDFKYDVDRLRVRYPADAPAVRPAR